jgi:hypothetical protein
MAERFDRLAVNGQPAVVRHGTCCNGEHWRADWYDPGADASYEIFLHLDVAQRLGATGLAPENVASARRLAELAAAMIPLPLGSSNRPNPAPRAGTRSA